MVWQNSLILKMLNRVLKDPPLEYKSSCKDFYRIQNLQEENFHVHSRERMRERGFNGPQKSKEWLSFCCANHQRKYRPTMGYLPSPQGLCQRGRLEINNASWYHDVIHTHYNQYQLIYQRSYIVSVYLLKVPKLEVKGFCNTYVRYVSST